MGEFSHDEAGADEEVEIEASVEDDEEDDDPAECPVVGVEFLMRSTKEVPEWSISVFHYE